MSYKAIKHSLNLIKELKIADNDLNLQLERYSFLKKGNYYKVLRDFFILLSLTLFMYTLLPPLNMIFGIPVLLVIGILNFAPHALLVSTIPMEFSTRKAASAATGFIDGCGYIGAAVTSFTSGALIGAVGSGAAFLLWIVVALAGGLVMIAAWNALPEKGEYL